jgi:hypothetical protein
MRINETEEAMNNRRYMLALCCLMAVAVTLILFIIISMIVASRDAQGTEAETNPATDPTTNPATDSSTEADPETETDREADYSSFYEGMSGVELYEVISATAFSIMSDFDVVFAYNESNTFCLIQKSHTPPDYLVRSVTVHQHQTPSEADLEMLVPGTPITEVVDVWGCPTKISPWPDYTQSLHIYVLEDGRKVSVYYWYDKESSLLFLEKYSIK